MSRCASGSLFAVSAALLLLELYWVRSFAESEWGHLASMVISTALLGFGAGGTVVFLLGERVERRGPQLGSALLASFVFLGALAPSAVGRLPLEPMLLAWRPSAWAWVLARELLVALPFAAGAAFVALRFRLAPRRSPALYAVNLTGSGVGIVLGFLWMIARPTADLQVAAVACGAVGLALDVGARWRPAVIAAGALAVAVAHAAGGPPLSETKDLAQALRLPEARVLEERPGAPGRWTLLTSPALHVAAGVSLVRPGPTPQTRAVFVRGDLAEAAFAASAVEALRHRVFWSPYELRPPRSALVLGEGAVLEIQTAAATRASPLVAVVPDPRTRAALLGPLGVFAGLEPGRVEVHGGGTRTHLARESRRFDLVVLPPADSPGAAVAGLGAAAESWLLTIEGIRAALGATSDTGLLAVHRWTQAPPRDLLKLLATVERALEVSAPRGHLVLVQSWDAWVLCVSRTPFREDERGRLEAFAREHAFDVWLPQPPSGPPVHRLPGPALEPLLDRVLAPGSDLPAIGPFVLDPATDDRPFFHHYLSYRRLGEWLSLVREGSIVPSEWGDLFLGAGLASALLLGALLILVPAAVAGRLGSILSSPGDTLLVGCLGFGYIGLEIFFLHQGTRLLGSEGASAALTIGGFLFGSATGSSLLSRARRPGSAGAAAALVGAAFASAAALGLEPAVERISALPRLAGAAVFTLLTWVVAIPLGLPFPTALADAGRRAPAHVPWLFAVNGWASVVGAAASSLLAVAAGFGRLGFAAAGFYAMAGLLLGRRAWRGGTA